MASNKRIVNSQMPKGKINTYPVGGGECDRNHPPFDTPRSAGGGGDIPQKFFDNLGGAAGASARAVPADGTVAAGMASPGRGKGMPAAGQRRPGKG